MDEAEAIFDLYRRSSTAAAQDFDDDGQRARSRAAENLRRR
jgi:hypothetical protein